MPSVWFKKLLYLFVIIKCIYCLFYYDYFFGPDPIILSKKFINLGILKSAAFLLYYSSSPHAGFYFILPALALSACGFLKLRLWFVYDFIIWFLVINLHNKLYPTLTGGDLLLNQLLFFNCFISDKFTTAGKKFHSLRVFSHNMGVVAIIVQVCFVYFFAALAKFRDDSWLNGTAVITTSQTPHYSLPFIAGLAENVPLIFIILNYLVMAYQALFPLLIWIQKLKKPLLYVGILMHLYIAFAVGLVTFGLVMLVCYVYFWPVKKVNLPAD